MDSISRQPQLPSAISPSAKRPAQAPESTIAPGNNTAPESSARPALAPDTVLGFMAQQASSSNVLNAGSKTNNFSRANPADEPGDVTVTISPTGHAVPETDTAPIYTID
jgi:hypothetical protein